MAASAYELALALGAGSLGPLPGDDVAGAGVVFVIGLLAMLACAVLAPSDSSRPLPAALFTPAAAAFVVAFFYTYDPYYAPALRRYAEGGASWYLAVVALIFIAKECQASHLARRTMAQPSPKLAPHRLKKF